MAQTDKQTNRQTVGHGKYQTDLANMADLVNKLNGVGPVDNRPSNDKLLHFVNKKIIMCSMHRAY